MNLIHIIFFLAIFSGAAGARPNILLLFADDQRAIRDDRWKLIRYPLVDRTQLFDLQNDPDEITNLASDPQHAAKRNELEALLDKEMVAADDDAPLKILNPKPADWVIPEQHP